MANRPGQSFKPGRLTWAGIADRLARRQAKTDDRTEWSLGFVTRRLRRNASKAQQLDRELDAALDRVANAAAQLERTKWLPILKALIREKYERRLTAARNGLRGALSRWKGEERDALGLIIASLADLTDELGDYLPPRDLWPMLYGEMDRAGLEPTEQSTDTYKYRGGSITFEAFRKRVERARRQQ